MRLVDTKYKYEDLVKEYFDKELVPWLDTAKHGDHYYADDFNDWKGLGASGTRLRLDWELTDEAFDDGSIDKSIGKLMASVATYDLADLIENGDIQNFDSALLIALDGAKKRGKEPVSIKVPEMTLYAQRFEKKKSIEYTLYLVLVVNWE